jgi:thioredoxin-dependent peroxiredoxin
VRDEIEQYRRQHVRPFGLNPVSVEQHAAYAARLALPFPLLSDPGAAIARAYGATTLLRTIARSVYLIDRGGVILFSSPGAPGADISLEGLGTA